MDCQINNNSSYDISEIEHLIQDLFSFSQKRLGFKKPPVLNLMSDSHNKSPLGKTAHYDPSSMEITIFVDGRHPKDIMRSFSHELVHHCQNENGMFDNVEGESGDGYAQSNSHLRKMEKEAYLKGNMCFRDWEDGYKSSNPNILNERRIYKMSTKKWKNKELNTLLNEKWGFSMNLGKLNESSCGSRSRDDDEKKVEEDMSKLNPGLRKHIEKQKAKKGNDKKDGEKDGEKEDKPKSDSGKLEMTTDVEDKNKNGDKTDKVPAFLYKEADDEDDKKMGDNPEGITQLMADINKLSDKESESIYKMLLKKHGKKDQKEEKLREAVRNIIKTKLRKK